MLRWIVGARTISADLLEDISAPRGAVPTKINLRTNSGACSAISGDIMPPMEKPRISTCERPSARTKAIALAPI